MNAQGRESLPPSVRQRFLPPETYSLSRRTSEAARQRMFLDGDPLPESKAVCRSTRAGDVFSPVVLLAEAQQLARLSVGHRSFKAPQFAPLRHVRRMLRQERHRGLVCDDLVVRGVKNLETETILLKAEIDKNGVDARRIERLRSRFNTLCPRSMR